MSNALVPAAHVLPPPGHHLAILTASTSFLDAVRLWLAGDFGDSPRFHREVVVFWTAHELAGLIGREDGSPAPAGAFGAELDQESDAALDRIAGTFCALMSSWGWPVWEEAELSAALIERRRRRILRQFERNRERRRGLAQRLQEYAGTTRSTPSATGLGHTAAGLLEEADRLDREAARIAGEPLSIGRPAETSTDELASFVRAVRALAEVAARRRDERETIQVSAQHPMSVGDNRPDAPDGKPVWDRDARILTYGGTTCLEFAREAENQFALLDAFQSAGWKGNIRSPFHSRPEKLSQTIKDIRKQLKDGPVELFIASNRPAWRVRNQDCSIEEA